MWQELPEQLKKGNIKSLARCISLVENEINGYDVLLQQLPHSTTPVIGITGPPGAGKSTLTDALIGLMVASGKKVAVLCIDPSSPFNQGALLGDRIRMSDWYTHPGVFIRSLATKGSMGGLHPKIIEITELVKSAPFDYIIVETVGVGQSEIEIAGLADITVVVMVPESGDEVQLMKSGLMEIADVFAVNKSDRPGADTFVNNLHHILTPAFNKPYGELPVVKTIASQKQGVDELFEIILQQLGQAVLSDKKIYLLAEKAWQLICYNRMKDVDRNKIKTTIETEVQRGTFNLYRFVSEYEKEEI